MSLVHNEIRVPWSKLYAHSIVVVAGKQKCEVDWMLVNQIRWSAAKG